MSAVTRECSRRSTRTIQVDTTGYRNRTIAELPEISNTWAPAISLKHTEYHLLLFVHEFPLLVKIYSVACCLAVAARPLKYPCLFVPTKEFTYLPKKIDLRLVKYPKQNKDSMLTGVVAWLPARPLGLFGFPVSPTVREYLKKVRLPSDVPSSRHDHVYCCCVVLDPCFVDDHL